MVPLMVKVFSNKILIFISQCKKWCYIQVSPLLGAPLFQWDTEAVLYQCIRK